MQETRREQEKYSKRLDLDTRSVPPYTPLNSRTLCLGSEVLSQDSTPQTRVAVRCKDGTAYFPPIKYH